MLTITAFSQGTIKGRLIDSVGKQSLKDASITVLDARDSTLEVFGLAKDDGSFEVKNISNGNFIVQASFQGYVTYFKNITVTKDNSNISLGNIYLKYKAKQLDEVVVTEAAIRIKGDTTEYNAGSFKTKPNAVVEDLLKKLPGMQVDQNGNVSHAGEAIQRILVDGKRFMGDDPKLATKNLPPDIVDKIQVFDDMSDQSKFSGFDDGNRVKTLNITTKKDKRKGYFGKGVASAGLDNNDNGVFDESLSLNRFNGNQQISLIGQANNINKQNFTSGNNSSSNINSTSPTGKATTFAGGTNFRDSWGKSNNTDVSGSYFFNSLKNENGSTSATQTNISNNPDSVILSNKVGSSVGRNLNNRVNLNIESKIDSLNSLVVRPNFTSTNSHSLSSSNTNTIFQKSGTPIYDANSNSNSESNSYNATIDATYRHRLRRPGQTYSININAGTNSNEGDGLNFSNNTYYSPSKLKTIDQKFNSTSSSNTFSTRLSYTQPITRNQLLEFNYGFSYSHNPSNRQTYLLNGVTGNYDILDSMLTNVYDNTYHSNTIGLNYRMQKQKFNFTVGTGVQLGEQNSVNQTKNYTVDNKYTNLTPAANFTYNFTKTRVLRMFYSGRTGQPSVSQLQPLVITSDSINFSSGNPNLKQQFTHSLRLLYHSFDVVTQQSMFVTINASAIQNDIQNSTTYLSGAGYNKLSQITIPVNLNGTYNASGTFMYSFPLRKPKSNLTLTTNASYNQYQNLVNDTSNYTRNTRFGETIGWTTNLKDNFDMNFFSTTTYNRGTQTINKGSNSNYFNEVLTTEATYYTHSGWILASDFSWIKNWGLSQGFNASYPLWNASLSKQVFKNKAGEIKFYVFDLLNQNANVTHTVSNNTVTDSRNMVLPRYFMLSFTYNLRKFPGAGQQQKMPSLFRKMDGFDGGGMHGGVRRMGF
jgi:hypothetical protein